MGNQGEQSQTVGRKSITLALYDPDTRAKASLPQKRKEEATTCWRKNPKEERGYVAGKSKDYVMRKNSALQDVFNALFVFISSEPSPKTLHAAPTTLRTPARASP